MKKVGSSLYDEETYEERRADEIEIKKMKTSAGTAVVISLVILALTILLGTLTIKSSINAMIP